MERSYSVRFSPRIVVSDEDPFFLLIHYPNLHSVRAFDPGDPERMADALAVRVAAIPDEDHGPPHAAREMAEKPPDLRPPDVES